jgi:5'(3')-deoxyribonucleotidase
MKFLEYTNGYDATPEVYLDMDGVLADFFGPVAKHHGVMNWRDARKQRAQGGSKIDKIAKKKGYFLHLKPMHNAGKLVNGVLKIADHYNILSSPLLSAVEQSSREKSQWLQKHLKKNPPRAVLFDHEKFKFAKQADGTPNVLIDDYETNIKLWEANGGIGILYKDSECERALKQLQGAMHGKFKRTYNLPLAVLQQEIEQRTDEDSPDDEFQLDLSKNYFTYKEVLKFVKGVHVDGYSLDDPIKDYKVWKLVMMPTSKMSSPEKFDQDDRYRRVIDLDWDHIKNITREKIMSKPVVVDDQGWILDGNHRVTAARAGGIKRIPALIPYK